jgi:hypothetical protein
MDSGSIFPPSSFFASLRARRKKQKETKAICRLPDCLPSIAAKTALSSPGNHPEYFSIYTGFFLEKTLYIRDFFCGKKKRGHNSYFNRLLMNRRVKIGTANQTIDARGDAKTRATCSVTKPSVVVFGKSESNILVSIPETSRLITIKRQKKSEPALEICRSKSRLSIAVRKTRRRTKIPDFA